MKKIQKGSVADSLYITFSDKKIRHSVEITPELMGTETNLRTKYQFIHFVKPKTSVWSCRNNRSEDVLGIIEWYGPRLGGLID